MNKIGLPVTTGYIKQFQTGLNDYYLFTNHQGTPCMSGLLCGHLKNVSQTAVSLLYTFPGH